MRVRVLPSAPGEPTDRQYLTTFLINDRIAIDAGCLGLYGEPADQAEISDVFLTHSHADHTGSLPMFIENTFGLRAPCVNVHGHPHALECLREDVFNGRFWPRMIDGRLEDEAFLELNELAPEVAVEVAGLRVTPVLVDHVVPTFGYVVEDEHATVVFGGDSGPTERLWEVARGRPNVQGCFMEASFPDEMSDLAARSRHLTPCSFGVEAGKLPASTRFFAVHIKARWRAQTVAELNALELERFEVATAGREYSF